MSPLETCLVTQFTEMIIFKNHAQSTACESSEFKTRPAKFMDYNQDCLIW